MRGGLESISKSDVQKRVCKLNGRGAFILVFVALAKKALFGDPALPEVPLMHRQIHPWWGTEITLAREPFLTPQNETSTPAKKNTIHAAVLST